MIFDTATEVVPPARPSGHDRRYHELYEFYEAQERQGRKYYRDCWMYGFVLAIAAAAALWLGLSVFWSFVLAYRWARELFALLAGVLIYFPVTAYYRNLGYRMILEAQRTLILIDTEDNTRRAASLLFEMLRTEQETPPEVAAMRRIMDARRFDYRPQTESGGETPAEPTKE